MNAIYRSIWNARHGTFVAVSENAGCAGKAASSCTSGRGGAARLTLGIMAASVALACSGTALAAQPTGGVVTAGNAQINSNATGMLINQTTNNVVIDWQSFNISAGQSVRFVQPGSSSVALNRVLGADPSSILGSLSANGKVFLVNPNGVLFGRGASVNVGALVASTRDIGNADFMAGNYHFSGGADGAVDNAGAIHAADGGYVALLGAKVSNGGRIEANFGTVALAAGNALTLELSGDQLLSVGVDQGAVRSLVQNGGLIQADGGRVLLTTQGAGNLLQSAVNNTGVIRAQHLENHDGVIRLMGDMQSGTVNLGGTLDASAPGGGNGGFIETSAAHVQVGADARVSTASALGRGGNWLIDPQDFTIGGGATDNISGATLSALLVTNSVTISTATGPDTIVPGTPPTSFRNTAMNGNGDINVNQAVSWTASSSPTTLTLNAERDVNLNAAVTATNGNLQACCGRDVNVNAAITTVNGSALLGAGRNLNLNAVAAMTTTDGNLMLCAGNDINIAAKITLTRGSSIPAQSLNLPLGLVIAAGNNGTGVGTVIFSPLAPAAPVTGPRAPVRVIYNPTSYATPTSYLPHFTLTGGATLTQQMLVFAAGGDKTANGSTATTLSSLKGNPAGVSLVAGAGSAANFNDANVGVGKTITHTGYSLAGASASSYALPVSCCGPIVGRTTGTILAALVVPPVVVPPVVVPPVVAPPVVVPPPVQMPVPAGLPLPGETPLPTEVPLPLEVPLPIEQPGATQVAPPVEVAPLALTPPPLSAPALLVVPRPTGAPPQLVRPPVDVPPTLVQPPVDLHPAPPPDSEIVPKRPRKQDRN